MINSKTNNPAVKQSFDEKLFGLLVASVKDYAIFMIDPNGYILSWNKGAEHIKGYTEAEIVGEHISVFYSPDDNKKNEPDKNLAAALKNGVHEKEGWRLRKDGTMFWADVTFTPLYNDDQHIGFAKITRDITERKNKDEEKTAVNTSLKKQVKENTEQIISNELRFRSLIENSYDGICLFDRDMNVFYRSKSAERINGWKNTERAQFKITDLPHPDDRNILANRLEQTLNKPGVPIFATFRTMHKNGHYIWLECMFTNMLDDENINAIVSNFRDITQKRLAEELLSRSNKELFAYKYALDEAAIVALTDQRGIIKHVNRNFCKISQYNESELIGQDHRIVNSSYHDKDFIANLWKTIAKGQVWRGEMRNKAKDGSFYWVAATIVPFLNEHGKPYQYIAIRSDITERKHNEERIFEAAQTQAAILNALPPNIVLLDEHGKIIAVNESWRKFALQNNLGMPNYGIGYSYVAISEKATGVDKSDGDVIARGISDVISGYKNGFTMEYSCHSPTEKRWFQVVVVPLAEKQDKGAVVLHINITDRKLAEESLLQSEANLRSVFENTDLSIVLFDNELKIMSFNSNAKVLSIKYFTKKVAIGGLAFGYFPKERRPIVKQAVKRVIDNREIVEYEVSYKNVDDHIDWFEVKWVGVTDKNGKNIGLILTLKDITHRKRKQVERKKITADLLKRNNDLEQFAYIVSHNLRAPVANIQGLSNLLNSFTPHDEDCVEALQALSSSITNLDTVIADINDILQVNNEVNDKLEMVSLSSLIAEISESLSLLIVKNNVTICCDFKENEELFTLKSYIHIIFQNLITNSIKYKQANVDPVINITSKKSWNMITIIFKDNGRGIDMVKNGPHIFGLYKRFDTSVEGKGMGLFMVKIEVESLGGTISVESDLNAGTLFTINLPIKSLV